MDRYGHNYDRTWRGIQGARERYDVGLRGGYGADYSGGYGGMRSDASGSNWRNFPGEEGWYGGASHSRDARFGGEGYGGGSLRGERGFGGGYFGGYGSPDFESYGGYGGGIGGYGGGYGSDYRDVGGMRREGFAGQGGERGFGRALGGRGGEDVLGRMRAADLMTDNPETVTPEATLADAAKKMRDLDVGIIPVVDSEQNRRLRGVITDRDIAVRAVAEGKDIKNIKVSECMTSDVETVNKNDMVRDVMSIMKREQVRRVPVTDREGRLVGIIAQADVALDVAEGHDGTHLFADTMERISEPGHHEQHRQGARSSGMGRMGSQGRGTSGSTRSTRTGTTGSSSTSSQSGRPSGGSKNERGSNA